MKNLVLLWRLLTTVRNWPVYFLNRFGYMNNKSEVHFHLWNGMTIVGRPFSIDRAIINEEWLDRCYEPNQSGIHFDWKACTTILDIGSHIGTFTLYAAAKAPNAHITAFEPEPTNAAMLRRNIEINNLGNRVKAVEAAVSGTNGTITLNMTKASGSGGHSIYSYTSDAKTIEVPMVSLSSILKDIQHCDFLKIDCEGAEYEAFYNLSDEEFKKIGFIAMEYHHFSKDPTHTPVHLKKFLEDKGFKVMEPAKSLFFAHR